MRLISPSFASTNSSTHGFSSFSTAFTRSTLPITFSVQTHSPRLPSPSFVSATATTPHSPLLFPPSTLRFTRNSTFTVSSFAFDSATITSYASLPRTALTFWNGMRQLMANVVLPFSSLLLWYR